MLAQLDKDLSTFVSLYKASLFVLAQDLPTFVSLYKASLFVFPLSAAYFGLGDSVSADASDSTVVLRYSLEMSESPIMILVLRILQFLYSIFKN